MIIRLTAQSDSRAHQPTQVIGRRDGFDSSQNVPTGHFGHFLSQGTRYAITTEASFHGASTFLRVFRGVFRSFSRGLNHPETCAGAFIRSALVLFALLPLLEPGASLTSTKGTSKTVSSVSERSQPSCLAASHSSRHVGFPFIIQTYVVVCVCVLVCSIERRLDIFVKALAQEDLAILVSWCGSAAAAARILRAGPQDPKRQATIFRRSEWLVCVWS